MKEFDAEAIDFCAAGVTEQFSAKEIGRLRDIRADQIETAYQDYRNGYLHFDLGIRGLIDKWKQSGRFESCVLSHPHAFKIYYLNSIAHQLQRELTSEEHATFSLGSTRAYLWHVYEQEKIIYTVTPGLWDAMKDMDYPTDFPVSQLQFPSNSGIWLTPDGPMMHSFLQDDKSMPLQCVLMGIMVNDSMRMSNLLEVIDPRSAALWDQLFEEETFFNTAITDFSMSDEKIGDRFNTEIMQNLPDAVRKEIPMQPREDNSHRVLSKPFLNMLYYLSGQEDICAKYPAEKPQHVRKSAIPSEIARKRKPREYVVGERHDAILRHIAIRDEEERKRTGEPTGRKLPPHLRSGHFKTVHKGKRGQTVAQKVFVSPYATGGKTLDDFPELKNKQYFSVLVK